jgi:exodeoxyribonuclease-5
MQWSPQQVRALQAIQRWLADPRAKQVFRVFGWAGTGKTTLARQVAEDVDGRVMFMSFTGKAALVLSRKGCSPASTIHSAIYKPDEDPLTGETRFKLNPDSDVAYARLVVVDEVGMVNKELGQDLESYGTRILVLGDPEQLPPIEGAGYFTDCEPDVMLTEIHRQAAESPIIRMSIDVREGRMLQVGAWGDSKVITRDQLQREEVLAADQVLVGRNRTRQTFNSRIRQLKNLEGERPVFGDRLVCLKNNRTKGLLNGSLWEPLRIHESPKPNRVKMTVKSLDDPKVFLPVDVETPIEFFRGTEADLEWFEKKHADQFTFGWALTCHKAQGSQWDHVFVFDESAVFRENAKRWLYTALTRAAERVTIVKT